MTFGPVDPENPKASRRVEPHSQQRQQLQRLRGAALAAVPNAASSPNTWQQAPRRVQPTRAEAQAYPYRVDFAAGGGPEPLTTTVAPEAPVPAGLGLLVPQGPAPQLLGMMPQVPAAALGMNGLAGGAPGGEYVPMVSRVRLTCLLADGKMAHLLARHDWLTADLAAASGPGLPVHLLGRRRQQADHDS